MIEILVDADGCPVKDETYVVATRYGVPVTLVANARLAVPPGMGVELVVVAVPCAACHRPAAKSPAPPAGKALATAQSAAVLRFDDRRCIVCHRDPHVGQFAVDQVTDCSRCHGLATWRIARFDHDRTKFRLDGAHARTACASCHRQETIEGQRAVRYRPLATACRSCHADMKLPTGDSPETQRGAAQSKPPPPKAAAQKSSTGATAPGTRDRKG